MVENGEKKMKLLDKIREKKLQDEIDEVYRERTEELNRLHLERHIFGDLDNRPIAWACDDTRLQEGYDKVYLIDGDTAVHGMEDIEDEPITREELQKDIDFYVKYFGGTYLKYGCMLVDGYGRPKLYIDEKEEQHAKEGNSTGNDQ
jgi:hypothetical protein